MQVLLLEGAAPRSRGWEVSGDANDLEEVASPGRNWACECQRGAHESPLRHKIPGICWAREAAGRLVGSTLAACDGGISDIERVGVAKS